MGDSIRELPNDILVEIFGWCLEKYSFFRVLSKNTRELKTPYDGWDSLIAQGVDVKIKFNDTFWFLRSQLHSRKIPGGILPAREYSSVWGFWAIKWYHRGSPHRDNDLPAYENASGRKEWWVYGKRHREGDKPAITRTYGESEWWIRGKRTPDPKIS